MDELCWLFLFIQVSVHRWSLLVLTGARHSLFCYGRVQSLQTFLFQNVYLRGAQIKEGSDWTGNGLIYWRQTAVTKYFCIALLTWFYLFRCTFTAVQLCALRDRAPLVNQHATERVRETSRLRTRRGLIRRSWCPLDRWSWMRSKQHCKSRIWLKSLSRIFEYDIMYILMNAKILQKCAAGRMKLIPKNIVDTFCIKRYWLWYVVNTF